MKLYYKIWVDCILRARSLPQNQGTWKLLTMSFMSMAMAIKFMVLVAILERYILKTNFYKLDLDIFPGNILDVFSSFFILYLLPMLIINYFLIFYNGRYEKLIQKYPYRNGKLFGVYFALSMLGPVLILCIAFIINRA